MKNSKRVEEESIFLSNLHYFFGQTDGSYQWPGGVLGDLLKQAKKEIESHIKQVDKNQ